MGIFSKIWKGIKKTVKKIAKGIKKVFKKVGAAIGKLGIVGQIGMMLLMPYAMGALGSFFGATGKIATWSSSLLTKGGFARSALAHTLNAVNTAGTFIGKIYTGITDTISKAFDVVRGKATLADVGQSAKSIFTGPAESLKLMKPEYVTQKLNEKLATEAATSSLLDFDKVDPSGGVPKTIVEDRIAEIKPPDTTLDIDKIFTDTKTVSRYDERGFLKDPDSYKSPYDFAAEDQMLSDLGIDPTSDPSTWVDQSTTTIKPKKQQSLLSRGFQHAKDKITGIDVEGVVDYGFKAVEQATVGAVMQTGQQKLAKEMGYEVGEQNDYYINIPDVMSSGFINPSVYKEVDFTNMFAQNGNNTFATGMDNWAYINSLYGDPSVEYNDYMAAYAGSIYQPRTLGA